jgi:hypothetical protein
MGFLMPHKAQQKHRHGLAALRARYKKDKADIRWAGLLLPETNTILFTPFEMNIKKNI